MCSCPCITNSSEPSVSHLCKAALCIALPVHCRAVCLMEVLSDVDTDEDITLTGVVKTIHVTPSLHGGVVKLPLHDCEILQEYSAVDTHQHTEKVRRSGFSCQISVFSNTVTRLSVGKSRRLYTCRQSRTCPWERGLPVQRWCCQGRAHSPTGSRVFLRTKCTGKAPWQP